MPPNPKAQPAALSERPHSHSALKSGDKVDENEQPEIEFWRLSDQTTAGAFAEWLFDKHPEPMWVLEAESQRFLSVNDAAVEYYGYSRDEFLDKSISDIQRDEVHLEHDARIISSPSRNRGRHFCRHVRKDGSAVIVEALSRPVEFGGRRAILTMLNDATQYYETEQAYLRLVAAIEQTAESIMISDTSGVLLYVNPAFERVTGYSREEIVGHNVRIFKSGQHDDEFYQRMWNSISQGVVWSGQVVNKKKDGSLYNEEMTISPVRDASGRIVNYVAVKRDVTRELALEEQLRQSQKMEAVGHLAGGIAHDFNNLLTVIQGNSALLLEDPSLDPFCSDLVNDIAGAAERASGLTRQLLVVSRKQAMQLTCVNLNEIMESLARMLRRVLGESVVLRCTYAPNLPPVQADRGMLQQVLLNLVLNARDAMPNGGELEIGTSSETVGDSTLTYGPNAVSGPYVLMQVRDTGCGIAPENLSRIFDPFFTTKEVGKGTGLGLATVYSIVKQHHGWIETVSEINRGTAFRVYLPAIVGDTPNRKANIGSTQLPGGPETILVAEDDPAVRRTLCKLLERCGYTVLGADSGVSALALWETHKHRIQLLLTDIMMPGGILGPELASRLKSQNPRLKVIFTSGYESDVTSRESHSSENFRMIQKPWRPQDVAETIRECLDREDFSPS